MLLVGMFILTVTMNAQEAPLCGFYRSDNMLAKAGVVEPRPTLSGAEQTRTTTNFKIHYTLSDRDATTQAYADSVAVYAEYARTAYANLGWSLPPPDGTNGGDSLYDIYIWDVKNQSGWSGRAVPEYSYPNPFPNGYTSWIEITQDSIREYPYPKYLVLRSTVAHEFHHSCQIRYRYNQDDAWFYENTSTYMEDLICPGINFIKYFNELALPGGPLTSPELPITSASLSLPYYQYGGGLFAKFLNEYYGSNTLQSIWGTFGIETNNAALYAINQTLVDSLSSEMGMGEALTKYAEWRYFTGRRADTFHFIGADQLPAYYVTSTYTTYPQLYGQSDAYGPGGARFIEFVGSANNYNR
jgi:hypothetical protein